MSKYLKILVATLAAVALATPAVALTLDAKGLFIVAGIMSDNVRDADDDNDDSSAAVEQRFRLMTTAALNDAVKAVIELESDYAWGQGNGALRADQTNELELRSAYLDFTTMDANFKVGTHTFNLGSGYIINEQASGISVKYRGLGLSWIKIDEQTNTAYDNGYTPDSEGLEKDYYGVNYAVKAGDFTLVPEVGYMKDGDANMDVYFFGAGAKGQMDKLSLQASLMFSSWDVDGGDDGLGTAAFAKALYVDGPTSFGISAAYVGDEDTPTGEFVDVEGLQNWSEVLTGGEFSKLTTAGIAALDGVGKDNLPGLYYSNYMYVRLDAGTRLFNEKSGIRAAYIYAQQAADMGPVSSITFGHEIDAYFDYAITKGLKWTTGGGYLLVDDEFGEALSGTGASDNMWKLGTKLTYVF
ncbi:hypothetical protein MJO47_03105 [Desulfuromonas sp. KJ2020]|uniref:hypothetical protein n=1 Tax=Desulfuromonas sp. KJ2020 TaxID=2919173 RepID=UPI0020A6FD12|nr:hypothetical protein [Desulfuromonas sp. KJ2020]MCP3176081.1 hypothetical protein [Desulfuromonas sp. KJ2020]